MTYEVVSDLTVTNVDNVLTINGGDTTGNFNVTIKASANNSVYEKTFKVTVVQPAIQWSTIPNQRVGSNSSITIDLSNYYVNNINSEPTLSARESGDVSYFSLTISGTNLTISPVVTTATSSTIYVSATVNEKTYTTSFNVLVGDIS